MVLYSNISNQRHYCIGVDFIRLEGNNIVAYADTEEDDILPLRITLLSLSDLKQFKKCKSNKKLLRSVKETLEEVKDRPGIINLKQHIENVARKHKNNNIKHDQNIKYLA